MICRMQVAVNEVRNYGALAQLGERGLCKPEVRGSIPLCSTIKIKADFMSAFIFPDDVSGDRTPRGQNSPVDCFDPSAAKRPREELKR